MKLAICDDEKTALETIAALTEDYVLETRHALEYEVFDSYDALRDRIGEFDVFLLDYKMPGVDGMTFARSLREQYKNKIIIFITAYDEIVLDAFTVRTHRFLMKPIDREKFFESLDSLYTEHAQVGQFLIKTGSVTDVIDLRDINYFQVIRKELYVCTSDEQLVCRRSISSVQTELEGLGFFRIHRSVLVNLRNIKSFNRQFAEFPNGERVAIGSRRYAEFCKAYLREKP